MDTSFYELLDYLKMCNKCERNFERKLNSYTRYLIIVDQHMENFLNEYKEIELSIQGNQSIIDQMNSLELMDDMAKRILLLNIKMLKKGKMIDKYAKKIYHEIKN